MRRLERPAKHVPPIGEWSHMDYYASGNSNELGLRPLKHKSGTNCFPRYRRESSKSSSYRTQAPAYKLLRPLRKLSSKEFKIFTKNGDFINNTCG